MGEPADCGGDGFFSPICYEYRAVAPTLRAHALPGLLNLLPFLWLIYRDRTVRIASLVAGSLGMVRVAAPIYLDLVSSETIAAPDGHDYFEFDLREGGGWAVWSIATLASVVSLLTWFAFSRQVSAGRPDAKDV